MRVQINCEDKDVIESNSNSTLITLVSRSECQLQI